MLILVTLMTIAPAACGSRTKTEKFLEKSEKILADYITLTGESMKNPNDAVLNVQLEKINDKLEKSYRRSQTDKGKHE